MHARKPHVFTFRGEFNYANMSASHHFEQAMCLFHPMQLLLFCLPIQTGRLERQVSLQDNNCLGQFRFSRHERYTGRCTKPHPQ